MIKSNISSLHSSLSDKVPFTKKRKLAELSKSDSFTHKNKKSNYKRKTQHKSPETSEYAFPSNLTEYTNIIKNITSKFNYNHEYNNATCNRGTTPGIILKQQQEFVSRYINLYTPFTGIVLWHGLGSGKTLSAISISEQYISDIKNDIEKYSSTNIPKKYTILFISPAMLVSNFDTELKRYDEYYEEIFGQKEIFDNSDYANFTSNGKLLKYDKTTDKKGKSLFKNKVIIIDESQILISTVANALQRNKQTPIVNAYEDMMKEETAKVVCLSGTPIDKTPYELGVLFNLLAKRRKFYKLTNIDNHLERILEKEDDFTKSIDKQMSSYNVNTQTMIIYRCPVYFYRSSNDKYVYTSQGNAFSDEEFKQLVEKYFMRQCTVEYSPPLFDLSVFNTQYKLDISNPKGGKRIKSGYQYNVYQDTSDKRQTDIDNGNTPRTATFQNKEEFKQKVSGYLSYFGDIHKILPTTIILDEAKRNRNSEEYRIGHSNNGSELFTVHRCQYSEYQQGMIDLFQNKT